MWFSELPSGSVVVASGVDSIVVDSMLLDSVVEVSIDVGSLVVDSMDSMVVVSMDSIVEDSMVVVDSINCMVVFCMVEVPFVIANVVVEVDNAGLVAVAVTGFSGTFFSSSILNTTLNTSPKFSKTCSIVFFAMSVQVSNENSRSTMIFQ